MTKGAVPNNFKNHNDVVVRVAGARGYFKPSFCHWPTGGYTRKEVQHNHRQGEYDVGPQSYEHRQFYEAKDVGTAVRGRQSDLAVMGSKSSQLTQAALESWLQHTTTGKRKHATRPDLNATRNPLTGSARPNVTPSEAGSDKTASTLCLGVFSQTKGTAFEPQPKPAKWSTPWFADGYPPRAQSAQPAIRREREKQKLGECLNIWEQEERRQNEVLADKHPPFVGGIGHQTAGLAKRVAEAQAIRDYKRPGKTRPASAHPTVGRR
jgi:hypothetical protein